MEAMEIKIRTAFFEAQRVNIRYSVKEELVLCELVMERLSSHVEFVELLKVENALMRLSAEPVVEIGAMQLR